MVEWFAVALAVTFALMFVAARAATKAPPPGEPLGAELSARERKQERSQDRRKKNNRARRAYAIRRRQRLQDRAWERRAQRQSKKRLLRPAEPSVGAPCWRGMQKAQRPEAGHWLVDTESDGGLSRKQNGQHALWVAGAKLQRPAEPWLFDQIPLKLTDYGPEDCGVKECPSCHGHRFLLLDGWLHPRVVRGDDAPLLALPPTSLQLFPGLRGNFDSGHPYAVKAGHLNSLGLLDAYRVPCVVCNETGTVSEAFSPSRLQRAKLKATALREIRAAAIRVAEQLEEVAEEGDFSTRSMLKNSAASLRRRAELPGSWNFSGVKRKRRRRVSGAVRIMRRIRFERNLGKVGN